MQVAFPLTERDFTAVRYVERHGGRAADALLSLMAG